MSCCSPLYLLHICRLGHIFYKRVSIKIATPRSHAYTSPCGFIVLNDTYFINPSFLIQLSHTKYALPVLKTWIIVPSIRGADGLNFSISRPHPVISQFGISNTSVILSFLKDYICNIPIPVVVFLDHLGLDIRASKLKYFMVYMLDFFKPTFKCHVSHLI